MIDLLVMLHTHENFRSNCPVSPPQIPLSVVLVCLHLPLQLLCHLRNHFVLTI
jgi:hypothetical protein